MTSRGLRAQGSVTSQVLIRGTLSCALLVAGAVGRAAVPETARAASDDRGDVRIDVGFGAALTNVHDTPATPLDETFFGEAVAVGVHAGYWRRWLGAQLWCGYQYDVHRWQLMLGPGMRYRRHPYSLSLDFKAGRATLGGVNFHSGGASRFAVSPGASAELELGDHWYVGLRYGLDVPLHAPHARTQRIMATQGWRF